MTGEKTDSVSTLAWGVRLLYLEFAGLALLTVIVISQIFRATAIGVPVVAAMAVMAAIGAVSVFFVARALGRRRQGARGPAIVVQLFTIATGGFLVQTDPLWAGILLIVLGAGTGLLILLPPSSRELGVGN